MKKKYQLFLIPYAGGDSYSFTELIQFLPEYINPTTIEYPGRGKRIEESYAPTFSMLIEDVVSQIERNIIKGMPIAILGYSMGAIIAYEIVRKNLIHTNIYHLFLCAQGDIRCDLQIQNINLLNADEMIRYVEKLGGININILKNKRFLMAMIKPLQHDYILRAQYKFEGDLKQKLNCNITILYSPQDISSEHILGWKDLIEDTIDIIKIGTNHFFIKEDPQNISDIIVQKLS